MSNHVRVFGAAEATESAGSMTARLLGGLVLVFALFHGIAAWLGSDRGQWGLVVAAIVVAATATYERFVLAPKTPTVLPAFGRPHARGMLAAVFGVGPRADR